jgi:DNA-binding response OmpR family regulator
MSEKQNILIIEDDTDLVAAIARMLENKGYHTLCAYDTEEGLVKLEQGKPDLIILDVMFGSRGESKGIYFAQKVKSDKQYSGIPILMITAFNTERPFFNISPETDAEYLPVDAFLDKPVKSEDLYLKVEELLNRNKGE